MQRLVSSLLILLLLVSQILCVAHSHAGTSLVEPEGHSARPHVHLHGDKHHHGHHHRRHDSRGGHQGGDSHEKSPLNSSERGPVEHDSDAFYVFERQLAKGAKPVEVAKAQLSVDGVVCDVSILIVGLRLFIGQRSPPPSRCHKCPLYLQILSIRC